MRHRTPCVQWSAIFKTHVCLHFKKTHRPPLWVCTCVYVCFSRSARPTPAALSGFPGEREWERAQRNTVISAHQLLSGLTFFQWPCDVAAMIWTIPLFKEWSNSLKFRKLFLNIAKKGEESYFVYDSFLDKDQVPKNSLPSSALQSSNESRRRHKVEESN